MPSSPRLEAAGAIHHVWQRGNHRRPIYIDDLDRRFFLRLLAEGAERYGLRPLSYCLMGNHFHLVIETPDPTLGPAMRTIGSRYVQFFNARHETGGGRLYQGRFRSRIVTSDAQYAQLLRYVARNPVAAGLCASPEEWPWSSHTALLAGRAHPLVETSRAIELLEVWGGSPNERYAHLFAADGPLRHIDPDVSPWEMRPRLEELMDADASPEAIRRAREHGYRLSDIAALTGLAESTISRRARR